MKTKQTIILFLFAAFLLLAACSSDDSSNVTNGAKLKSILEQRFNNGVWQDTFKTTFDITDVTMPASILVEEWSLENSRWFNSFRLSYTFYNSNGTSQYVNERWNPGTETWYNSSRFTYTNNANEKRIMAESESWILNDWNFTDKVIYTYDGNAYLVRSESFMWNDATSQWNLYSFHKKVYINNEEGKLIRAEYYTGNNTVPYSKETLTYDSNGFVHVTTGESNSSGSWLLAYRIEQTTLPNGNIQVINQTFYDDENNVERTRLLYQYY